jgi:hypothetical protein
MWHEGWRRAFADAVGALGCSPEAPVVTGVPAGLPSRLPVGEAAVGCVAAALGVAAESRRVSAALDAAHVAAAVRSEAYVRVDGRGFGSGFAELSRFWRAADGWVRTHANYPWHRDALLRALGTGDDADAVGSAIGERRADDVEAAVVAAGGVAAAVRTGEQWRRHPHGLVVAEAPLIGVSRAGAGPPRDRETLRVLDLTRVIAGPVATRYLAALGADVLRIDPPHRPELPVHRFDGLPGKRSAILDARTADGFARLHELLDGADILVQGYRPGALARFGLDIDSLAERHPGLVVVSLSAWGRTGPWGDRRGFDSIVQAASGIAMVESPDGDRPGRLPCQLLDHATGYLAAACALEGVRRTGGTHAFDLSLAATSAWLLGLRGPTAADEEPSDGEWFTTLRSDNGPVTAVTPPGSLGGHALSWAERLSGYGKDPASW